MRVTTRPTILSDFLTLIARPPAYRCQCLTAELDGRILGLGGFLFPPGGDVWCSAYITDEGRRYPVALHRVGLAVMDLGRRRGFRMVYAAPQPDNPAAERWLERLGFVFSDSSTGEKVFVWEPCGTTAIPPQPSEPSSTP